MSEHVQIDSLQVEVGAGAHIQGDRTAPFRIYPDHESPTVPSKYVLTLDRTIRIWMTDADTVRRIHTALAELLELPEPPESDPLLPRPKPTPTEEKTDG